MAHTGGFVFDFPSTASRCGSLTAEPMSVSWAFGGAGALSPLLGLTLYDPLLVLPWSNGVASEDMATESC